MESNLELSAELESWMGLYALIAATAPLLLCQNTVKRAKKRRKLHIEGNLNGLFDNPFGFTYWILLFSIKLQSLIFISIKIQCTNCQ